MRRLRHEPASLAVLVQRRPVRDVLPADRAPTDAEAQAYRSEAARRRAEVPPTDREELDMAHEMLGEGGE
jgi:hypothetical protein